MHFIVPCSSDYCNFRSNEHERAVNRCPAIFVLSCVPRVEAWQVYSQMMHRHSSFFIHIACFLSQAKYNEKLHYCIIILSNFSNVEKGQILRFQGLLWFILVICESKMIIFVFWTNQDIWGCQFGLWKTMISIFLYFISTFYVLHTKSLTNW